MINHLFLKPVLIFLGGTVFAVIGIQAATHFDILKKFDIAQNKTAVEEEIRTGTRKVADETAKAASETLKDKVLSAIAESPALAPIFNTTRQIEDTINSIKSLPDEQRNAVCRQICGE